MVLKWRRLMLSAMGIALATGSAGAVVQAKAPEAATPSNWSYELRDGKRVPKGNRVTNGDGSWREEMRQGQCTTVKEKTPNGDYSETRKCD